MAAGRLYGRSLWQFRRCDGIEAVIPFNMSIHIQYIINRIVKIERHITNQILTLSHL